VIGWARCGFHKNLTKTHYAELGILHPVGSACRIVNSGASEPQKIDALFFMLGWDQYGFYKKHAGTRYAELVFLHSVGSADHVVHSGASGL
jgi:hypothetical protein